MTTSSNPFDAVYARLREYVDNKEFTDFIITRSNDSEFTIQARDSDGPVGPISTIRTLRGVSGAEGIVGRTIFSAVSNTPPSNPSVGDLWFNTSRGGEHEGQIWLGAGWVDFVLGGRLLSNLREVSVLDDSDTDVDSNIQNIVRLRATGATGSIGTNLIPSADVPIIISRNVQEIVSGAITDNIVRSSLVNRLVSNFASGTVRIRLSTSVGSIPANTNVAINLGLIVGSDNLARFITDIIAEVGMVIGLVQDDSRIAAQHYISVYNATSRR